MIDGQLATGLLVDLIGIPSVNPMGGGWEHAVPVERGVVEHLEKVFAPYGVDMRRQAVSAIHENLLVTVPGEADGPGVLFEAHADTVPAEDWGDEALRPRVAEGRVWGRGACDDKGPLASMVLALVDLLESGQTPPRPVHLLVAGDEEYAQTGIKHFRDTGVPVARAVFGEPTSLLPVVQHRGTVRWDITTLGRSAHTSRPELGHSAIDDMLRVVAALKAHEEDLRVRHPSTLTGPPTVVVTMIQGGRTRNAVPDRCTIALDHRVVPGMDPGAAREEIIALLDDLGPEIEHGEIQLLTPPLATEPDDPFADVVRRICSSVIGREVTVQGAPYGTDASWISDRAPAVVLGPGDISCAHAVGEHVAVDEVVGCAEIYREIMLAD